MPPRNGVLLSSDLQAALLKSIPQLRAFAISLCGNIDQADDLVQDAVVRGLSNLHRFDPASNLKAWLFTILRNQFHTSFRKKRREVEDPDGILAGKLSTLPEQEGHLDMSDLQAALAKLPDKHRELLILIGAGGMSYEEAAQVCGTNVGTIKSRMNRARARLAELLHVADEDDLGAAPLIRAALVMQAAPQGSMQQAA